MCAMTESTMIIILILSVSAVLVLRVVMDLILRDKLSGKGYKKYRENTRFWDRWFFVSARYIVRDKYSKFEGRIIRHTISMRIVFVLNIVMHIGLLAEVSVLLLSVKLKLLNGQAAEGAATVFFLLVLAAFGVLYCIESYENRRYHRMREKRRR